MKMIEFTKDYGFDRGWWPNVEVPNSACYVRAEVAEGLHETLVDVLVYLTGGVWHYQESPDIVIKKAIKQAEEE